MSKRIRLWLIAALALCAAAAVGVTLSFMFKKAEKTNTFIPAEVTCEVKESLLSGVKSDVCVKNTGNVAAYLRIRLVSYYVYDNGDIAGRVPSQYPTLTLQNGWIAGADHTYYYPTPVEPGAKTGILCDPITLGAVKLADGKTVYQVLEVFAEAIQAEPVGAVQEAWNVTVSGTEITPAP